MQKKNFPFDEVDATDLAFLYKNINEIGLLHSNLKIRIWAVIVLYIIVLKSSIIKIYYDCFVAY